MGANVKNLTKVEVNIRYSSLIYQAGHLTVEGYQAG